MKAYKVLLVGVCAVSLLLTLLIGCGGGGGGSTSTHPTANPNALPRAKALLNYFYSLKDLNTINPNSNKSIISGEAASGVGTGPFGVNLRNLYNQTGKWVAYTFLSYFHYFNHTDPPDPTYFNPYLIDYWNNGGLINMVAGFRDPCDGTTFGKVGDYPCVPPSGVSISTAFTNVYTEGTAQNTLFKQELDILASGFQALSDAGVVVIFSPFEENNACSWSWYCSGTSAQFKALWQYVFNYFTNVKHLNNILWLYEGTAGSSSLTYCNAIPGLYPGDAYVDLVGMSVYIPLPGLPSNTVTACYNTFNSITAKPIIFQEYGIGTASVATPNNSYDNMNIINGIKANYPLVVIWMNWARWGMENQNNASQLLNDPRVINRGDIKF